MFECASSKIPTDLANFVPIKGHHLVLVWCMCNRTFWMLLVSYNWCREWKTIDFVRWWNPCHKGLNQLDEEVLKEESRIIIINNRFSNTVGGVQACLVCEICPTKERWTKNWQINPNLRLFAMKVSDYD